MRHLALLITLLCFAIPARAQLVIRSGAAQPTGPTLYLEQSARATAIYQAASLLHDKQFEELNAMAERYRTGGETTPSGEPLLEFFYEGLKSYALQQISTMPDKSVDAQWGAMTDVIKEWIRKAPSPAHIALAKFYNNWAGAIRGDGYAKEVAPAAWAPFFAKLAEAHKVLDASKQIASVDPEWYRAMIVLARQEKTDPEAVAALFKEALERHQHYGRLYLGMAESMQPKWGGSWKLMDSFARYAVTNTADKSLYARIYVDSEGCGCELVQDSNVDWKLLKASFTELVKGHPTQWNISAFAYFACMAKDKTEARAQLLQMTEFDAATWENQTEYYAQCRKWAAES